MKIAGTKLALGPEFILRDVNEIGLSGAVDVRAFSHLAVNGVWTAAFNAAMTQAALVGSSTFVPAGTYPIKAVVVPAGMHLDCAHGAVFTPADLADATSANYLLQLSDNSKLTGATILGEISTTFGALPKPYYGIRASDSVDGVSNVTIRDVVVTGCLQGIWAINSDGMTVENVTVDRCYQWGLAFPAPRTRRLRVNGFRAYSIGINEGLKIASLYQQEGDATADIQLTNLEIHGCGKLNPDSAQWQNGIDLFTSAAQRVEISNFSLVGNGGGGIEIKRNHAPDITPNVYKNVRIQNGHITQDNDGASGISLNITSPDPIAVDTALQVAIADVVFQYDGATNASSANAIAMNAWADVTISDCDIYGAFTRGVNPSASGSFDNTLRRLTLRDVKVNGAKNGLVLSSGVNERVQVTDCEMYTTGECITSLSGATGSRYTVEGGIFETTGAATPAILIGGNVTGVEIRHADVRATTYAIRANNGGGEIKECRLASAEDEAIRISGGAWVQADNDIVVLTTKSAYITTAGTIVSVGNRRGTDTSAPTLAAKVGEIVRHATPAAAGTMGWVCTTAGNPGTWKAISTIES